MISGISSRSKGSPPENSKAGGLGVREFKNFKIVSISCIVGSYPTSCSGKMEKQTEQCRSQRFVTSITPITVSEIWSLHEKQAFGQFSDP
jgi:hypothetical protein